MTKFLQLTIDSARRMDGGIRYRRYSTNYRLIMEKKDIELEVQAAEKYYKAHWNGILK